MWFDANYFYDKTAIINIPGQKKYERGLLQEGEETHVEIQCDIQPVTMEQIIKEVGVEINAEYRLYCDIDLCIDINNTVSFQGVKYEIVKVIRWDDYIIAYLKAVV